MRNEERLERSQVSNENSWSNEMLSTVEKRDHQHHHEKLSSNEQTNGKIEMRI
jgi:hypothetical protein